MFSLICVHVCASVVQICKYLWCNTFCFCFCQFNSRLCTYSWGRVILCVHVQFMLQFFIKLTDHQECFCFLFVFCLLFFLCLFVCFLFVVFFMFVCLFLVFYVCCFFFLFLPIFWLSVVCLLKPGAKLKKNLSIIFTMELKLKY